MSKKFTSFLVVLAALLLTVPTQAQFAKKAAKQTTVLKAGPLKVNDVQKVKAAKMKAAAKYEGQAFTSKVFNSYLQAGLEKVQEDKAILEKQMEENLRQVKFGKMASILSNGKLSNKGVVNPRAITFDAVKPSTRRATNRAEVVDGNGIITSPAEGESKMYSRAGKAYYVSNQQLALGDQEGVTEIVETADGVVYIKDFISHVMTGAWVKGVKEGNTITIPAKQVVSFNTAYNYGLYVAKCTYVEGTGWAEVEGDITLTVDGNTITLNGTDSDNPVACFWTDDFTFSGYGDYETIFTYDPEYVAPELVEAPADLVQETWNAKIDGSVTTATVGFYGENEVYVKGILPHFPESWIKGTIDGTTITFPMNQFIGTYGAYNIFATGLNESMDNIADFVMTYDAAAKVMEGSYLFENAAEDKLYYLAYVTSLTLQVAPFEEESAVTGDPVDALPYSNALDSETAFADFGVLDSNSDGSTWNFTSDYGAYYNYNSSNAADDWLISPAIKLEAGKKYHFAIDAACASTSYPEVFEVLIGTEPKASALKQSVLAATQVASKEFATYENETVEVAETGYYHFGIHAISDANMWRLMVKNFLVEAGAEPTAPAAVTDFAVAQTPDVLETIVSFKAPAKTAAGEDLTDLTKIDVLRDGAVVKSLVNISEGAVAWTASEQGYENAQDVAAIDFGSGLTATMASGGNSNTPKYYTSGTALRMYGNNTMTITGSAIKKVVITMTGNDNQKQLTANVGEYALEGNVGTWTGSADEVVFTVVDGKQARIQKIEIETGLTLTPGAEYTVIDNAEDLTIGAHTYQVIPYNASGIGVKSEEKSIFLSVSMEVPHTFDFSQNLLELFGVIDNNGDGKTWLWSESYGAYYGYSSSNAADDYLITMPFKLKAGKKYNVIVTARNSGYDEKFEVLAGKEATVAGLTETVIPETTISADDEATNSVWNEYEGTFAPAEDGSYNFAIHATSDADMFNLCVQTLTVELAPEETAPAAVADLAVVAGAEGALEANLSFTAPAKAINGNALEGNVDVKIYRDNELLNTLTGVAAGAATTWKDTDVENGKTYTYYVVAANESGDGLKSEKKSVFVGVDEVGDVANILVTGTTANTISLKWDEVAGKNGGYVNLADVRYAAVSMHVEQVWFWSVLVVDEVLGTVTGQTAGTFDYACDEGEQDYKYFGVVAFNEGDNEPAAGEEYAGTDYTWALLGAPYTLPFAESFTGGNLAYSTWAVSGSENTLGFLTSIASDDDYGLAITTAEVADLTRLESGRVNINGVANPTLLFDALGMGVTTAKVFASKDDSDWEVIATVPVTEDYSTVKVPLLNANGERFIRFAIGADIVNPAIVVDMDEYGDPVYEYHDVLLIDNIKVVDLYEYNLVADIKAPKSVVAGQKAKIVATVTNAGENPVKDYVVSITAGNKALTNVIGDKELAPFTSDVIEVDYETSIFDEAGDVTLTVNVQYENELLPEDNTASAIITITEPTATAPTSLLAEDKGAAGVDLTWTVAEGGVAEITESFDDASVFEPFGLGGITADQHTGAFGDWTVYDGNGIGTYGFNGTDFPNAYQPMGFIVFNPSQVSEALAETYAPHSGDQFMMSFCPVEESNAPAADHWLISPELPGIAQTISFFARVITDSYGAETFEVWASSTDNKVESFTKVADYSSDATEWTEFSADLPAGTKYFAIRHTSTDIFGLMIDDVKFSANTTATAASFNIYYNNEKIATVEGDKTTYTVAADKVEVGTQTFGVSAVYANGAESRVTTATIEIVTGIEQIAADGKPVDVYSIDGKLIRNQAKSLDGLKGLYIVNGKKIMVK